MRATKRHEPGHLFRLLEQKAATDGFTREALVNRLGISYPHYFAMRSDAEKLSAASKSFYRACAEYLDVPVAQIMLWAGVIDLEDYGRPRTGAVKLGEQLDLVLSKMSSDSQFRSLAPSARDWGLTPVGVRLSISVMYEMLSQRSLHEAAVQEGFARVLKSLATEGVHETRRSRAG